MIDKSELQRYYRLKQEIESLRQQMAELRNWLDDAAPKAQVITGMPIAHGETPDKIGKVLVKMESLQEQYADKIHNAMNLLTKIENDLEALPEKERVLLRLHYIEGYNWDAVADKMNYTKRNILYLQWQIFNFKLKNEEQEISLF